MSNSQVTGLMLEVEDSLSRAVEGTRLAGRLCAVADGSLSHLEQLCFVATTLNRDLQKAREALDALLDAMASEPRRSLALPMEQELLGKP